MDRGGWRVLAVPLARVGGSDGDFGSQLWGTSGLCFSFCFTPQAFPKGPP